MTTIPSGGVYADYLASSPLRESAKKAIRRSLNHYGNPSSLHKKGEEASAEIDEAREIIAKCINAPVPEQIYFTSGGTESNNIATNALLSRTHYPINPRSYYFSDIEHHSVLYAFWQHAGTDCLFHEMRVKEDGTANVEQISNLRDNVVALMYANNETGVLQPLDKVSESHFLFSDAVSAVGHVKVDIQKPHIDMLSASGHKFGGPQGTGFLYSSRPVTPLFYGGGQEQQVRPGTQNVAGIVAMAAALQEACLNMEEETTRLREYTKIFEDVISQLPEAHILGQNAERLPGVTTVCFPYSADSLLMRLNQRKVYASSGAACNSGNLAVSSVLRAMRVPDRLAQGALRFSWGFKTTEEEVMYAAKALSEIILSLQN